MSLAWADKRLGTQSLPLKSSGPRRIQTKKQTYIYYVMTIVGKVQDMVGKQIGVFNSDQTVKGIGDPKATRSDTAHTLLLTWMGSLSWLHRLEDAYILSTVALDPEIPCCWSRMVVEGLGQRPLFAHVHFFPSLILVCFIYDPHFSHGSDTLSPILFPMGNIFQLKWQAGLHGCLWLRWCPSAPCGDSAPLISPHPTPSPPLDTSLKRWHRWQVTGPWHSGTAGNDPAHLEEVAWSSPLCHGDQWLLIPWC